MMKYKIVAGPTQMRVERFGLVSEPISIGEEYIDRDNQRARDIYYQDLHPGCVRLMTQRWTVSRLGWHRLKEAVKDIVDETPNLYFDGPSWIVSTVPWKQAKYGEWKIVPKKVRWLLKKEYTNGVRNRQKEALSVPSVQSE